VGPFSDEEPTERDVEDGVPVGAADAEADARRASDESEDVGSTESGDTSIGGDSRDTDQGVPVGRADAEADRRRASGEDDED
jgi:hypothetical protein